MRTLLLLACSLVTATPLAAQGWIEPLPSRPEGGVTKLRTSVTARVQGRVALVEVEEWFRNDGARLGEGDYLYPLPGEAVFSNFSLFQGDEELRGETMDAREARRIYQQIVRRKKDPALIELAGHGLVRARVFPINPGETRKITLRYTQMLVKAGDALQFRYAAGGRRVAGSPGAETGGPHPAAAAAPITFALMADSGAGFGDPFSPTHQLVVRRDAGRLTVRPDGPLHGDFTVFLPLAERAVGLTLATHRPDDEPGFFMLTLSPGEARGAVQPRDITVALDVSGSMSGSKLEQAKGALRQLLASLGPHDRFRLLTFSGGVTTYRREWTRATPATLEEARRWVDGLSANGGTNIAGALREVFRLESGEERLPIVLFLTDGLPSVGERDPERIAAQAEADRGRARVFAFGVGTDVNTFLLDRLSAAGRGTTEYVEPGEDVERALGTLAAKIQHPVLVDLEIAGAPVELTEVYPRNLPDLFTGEELVVFGRYRSRAGGAAGEVAVRGRRNGRPERFATRVRFPDHQLANDYLPRLWAARKIGELSRAIRLEGHREDLEREIRNTALRYGLLSEFTSYLVQEPTAVSDVPVRGPRDNMTRAPAPEAATGAGAVAAAEASRQRRDTKSAVDLASVDDALLRRASGPAAVHVAGRLFTERDGVWTDLAYRDSVPVVKVAPFSDAFFALLEAAPELEPYAARFERVLIAGRAVSIAVTADGVTRMSDQEVRRVVRSFRTR